MLRIANNFRRLRARLVKLCTFSNLGISSRLGIAFASVAILAAASNLIVENGVSLVEHVMQSQPGPLASSRTQESISAKESSKGMGAQLAVALETFDRAVRDVVEARSRKSLAQYRDATAQLASLASAFERESGLRQALEEHQTTAESLIQTAREQQQLLARYSTTFSKMNARIQGSIDSAWKIMGRVVARQSLLRLKAQLDEIQNRFAMRGPPGNASAGSLLIDAENLFADTLQKNRTSLSRSQGAQWYEGMHDDLLLLTATRAALTPVEARFSLLTRAFPLGTERLAGLLSRLPAMTAADIAKRTSAPWQPAITLASPQAIQVVATTQTSNRTIVAWVSVFVLALLAYLCVATIWSVVRPVRRLLAATVRIGKGQTALPVARGGIRELDTLAQAFNTMAGQLAAARATNLETLQSLETKVEERTRQLQELAERDPLTGLANRRQLFTALNTTLDFASAGRKRVGAFFLDIDNFKTLNDSMGHGYGDQVLVAIARRLEVCARQFGFAARLGGDEFMLVHEDAGSIDDIVASGHSIIAAFHDPIAVEGRELIVSVSVGASVFPDHANDVGALLRAADAALFNAKARGRSQLMIYTPDLLAKATAKFAIEQSLRRAVEKGEFELFYQPEVNVQTLQVTVVEALLRWRMPDGSYRYPGEFLAVAEESGLIMEICDWVLRSAIESASQWYHGPWPEVRVAINVSPRQFLDSQFVERLQALLEEFKLPPRCLELELTESVLQTGPATIAALAQLRAIDVAIALDDFGTGYSSLASIEQLPLTRIKLDRSLIARMDSNVHSASIARATIGLCSELGLKVTAEGVERLEQFTALLGYRDIALQGYLLAEPVPRHQLMDLLEGLPDHCRLLRRAQAPVPHGLAPPVELELVSRRA